MNALDELRNEHGFSDDNFAILEDKGLEPEDYSLLLEAMELPDESFAERRNKRPDWK